MTDFTLLYQEGDKAPELHHFPKLGGEVRLAFGEPGRRAAIWKVKADPKGEVYVMGREIAQHLKVSLHMSGDWRYQWLGAAQQAMQACGESRIIDQWNRPPAHGGVLTEGYSILTMGEDIIDVPSDTPPAKVVWLKGLQPGELGAIQIAFVRGNGVMVEYKGWKPVAMFPMRTGEAAMVLAMKRLIKEAEYLIFQRYRSRMRSMPVEKMRDILGDLTGLRTLIHEATDDGRRYALDLAAGIT